MDELPLPSPEEIESKQFPIGLRGYDVEEVRSFLVRMAAAYRQLLAELQRHPGPQAAGRPNHKAPQAAEPHAPYESVGREVTMVLAGAREAAEQLKDQARTRAAEMIEAAERKAFELQMATQLQANERLRELALSSQRIKVAETRLREELGQLEAVLAMTRFDLDQAAAAPPPPASPQPSPASPQPSPWRPVTAADGHEG